VRNGHFLERISQWKFNPPIIGGIAGDAVAAQYVLLGSRQAKIQMIDQAKNSS
jgi:hypothetical protein